MKHLGDITKINGAEIPKVNCIIGGSPCQDLSVAGKRAGLDGARSGLFMEQIRVIKEMREDDIRSGRTGDMVRPRYSIWENVPGAFSSNKGEDFRAVLEEYIHISEPDLAVPMPPKGKWSKSGYIEWETGSLAWREMDAQYWGLPQRRKRIGLVCDFCGHTAGNILFDTEYFRESEKSCGESSVLGIGRGCTKSVFSIGESLSGDTEPSIPPWKNIARNPEECSGECDK